MNRQALSTCLLVFGLALGPACRADGASALSLGHRGSVCIKADAPDLVQRAATELTQILGAITGGEAALARVQGAGEIDRSRPAIVLDSLAADLGLTMEKSSRARDGFRYKMLGRQLLVVGESPRGVYHGVFDFLESLGCGSYTPGAVGEVIPSRPAIALPADLDRSEVSDSINRRFWYGGKGNAPVTDAWALRNKGRLDTGSWSHAWGGLVPADRYFKDHPEYFSLNRGRRTPKQLCTTNPDAEFPLDGIADHLHFGGKNSLAVRVSSGDLAELGTGGLMKPVMIYRAGAVGEEGRR